MKAYILIDVQKGYVKNNSHTILNNIKNKIQNTNNIIILTQDIQFFNSDKWEITPDIENISISKNSFWVHKKSYADVQLVNLINDLNIDEVEIMGFYTDVCVIANALLIKSFLPNICIQVNESCCQGTNTEAHQAALLVMSNCNIDIVN